MSMPSTQTPAPARPAELHGLPLVAHVEALIALAGAPSPDPKQP